MKITDVRCYIYAVSPKRRFVLTFIETDEGITGVGEGTLSYPHCQAESVVAAIVACAGDLVGQDPWGVERHWLNLKERWFWRGGPAQWTALGALDSALWDIAGKRAGQPVHRLLGGPTLDRVRIYLNQWWGDAESTEAIVDYAHQAVAKGATALKWYPFRFIPRFQQPHAVTRAQLRRGIEEVQAVRDAVGPDVDLMVDVWRRLDLTTAAQFCEAVEDCGLLFIEEPVDDENPAALKKLRHMARGRLSTGERLFSRMQFRDIVEDRTVDIVQPDVLRVGGITECRKIAAMAETYGIGVAPHNPMGQVATATSVQLSATLTNFVILERLDDMAIEGGEAVIAENLPFDRDAYLLSDKPGLGITIDEAAVKKMAQTATSHRGR